MNATLTIPTRFRGPRDAGNGGYTAGCLAQRLPESCVEVTLRAPAPLERVLTIAEESGVWRMQAEARLIATARAATLTLDVPRPPEQARIAQALAGYVAPEPHPAPECFVCGNARAAADGLAIRVVAIGAQRAGLWRPAPEFADMAGRVRPEFIWALLDCPGGMALFDPARPMVTGRITARIDVPLRTGMDYIVAGWRIGAEGRKHYAGTALLNANGEVCALARSTWIELA